MSYFAYIFVLFCASVLFGFGESNQNSLKYYAHTKYPLFGLGILLEVGDLVLIVLSSSSLISWRDSDNKK
jgi:hypothetical protein